MLSDELTLSSQLELSQNEASASLTKNDELLGKNERKTGVYREIHDDFERVFNNADRVLRKASDELARKTALEPMQSFIVQAPAGSGKTELLIQRILVLLARVKQPEAIVAITFTRKAAHEMRERVLNALQQAQGDKPEAAHAQVTWALARAVLDRDNTEQWQLLRYPQRLPILTIDAFCMRLIQQFPTVSGLGSELSVSTDLDWLYKKSIRDCLEQDDPKKVSTLLLHLDNNVTRAEQLLTDLLVCRDQWLPYIGVPGSTDQIRAILEAGLHRVFMEELRLLQTCCGDRLSAMLQAAHFASSTITLPEIKPAHFTTLTVAALKNWQAIIPIFLTKEGKWRRQLTKHQGFPAASSVKDKDEKAQRKAQKAQVLAWLDEWRDETALEKHLHTVMQLPDPKYTEQQWDIISALMGLLPNIVAHLWVNFREAGNVDHVEIAERAHVTLNHAPTRLMLSNRIQHILMDEFQDTSSTQYRLLEQLTADWETDDARTVFLVGDPMQSIYRFRKAEVGLFLHVQTHGLGHIPVTPLVLTSNFRSQSGLVEWYNHMFSQLFPTHSDPRIGAVPYTSAHAVLPKHATPAVSFHAVLGEEHQSMVSLIRTIQRTQPDASIGVLVRAKKHVAALLPALKAAQIDYQATEMETLIEQPVIQDLLALTKAVLYPSDRLAWLSVLRAPWCGLTLKDLAILATDHPVIWAALRNYEMLPLSADGKARCAALVPLFENVFRTRHQHPIRLWLETLWLAGPAHCYGSIEWEYAGSFFTLVDECWGNEPIIDWSRFMTALSRLSLNTRDNAEKLTIMTIHKSKGLEFDVVILSGLAFATRQADPKLLLWMEQMQQQTFLLAPLANRIQQQDLLYHYVQQQQKYADHCELQRLFYVAATRAKQSIHLVSTIDDDPDYKPPPGSVLDMLWEQVSDAFLDKNNRIHVENSVSSSTQPQFKRVKSIALNWKPS